MIYLTIQPLYTFVKLEKEPSPAKVIGIINICCSARPSGFQYSPAYRNHTWDGYIKLFKSGKFPSGLARTVITALEEAGYELKVKLDYPIQKYPKVTPECLHGITLRDYQVEAVNLLLEKTRGIARMATGSGKTEVIAAILKILPGKAIVLTTKVDLLYQTASRLEARLQEEVGTIGDGNRILDKRVTVATIQTLSKLPDSKRFLADMQVVVFDECHHTSSKTAQQVMLNIPAIYRFGFSGTPLDNGELQDLLLIAATGNVVYDLSASKLADIGMAARPNIKMYVVNSLAKYNDYQQEYDAMIINNRDRNELVARLVEEAEFESALILVERLEHGKILSILLPEAIYANGSMPAEVRKDIISDLKKGGRRVVIATPIFDEGVDVPAVDLVVLAGAGKSTIRIMQRIGRGMRPKAGENVLQVIDFIDSTKYMGKQSLERALLYEKEGFSVEVIE